MDFAYRDLLKEPPDLEELKELAGLGGLPLKELINIRSQAYKKLKPDLTKLDEKEIAALIKQLPRILLRPVLAGEQGLITGFQEEAYREFFLQTKSM